jgi:PAS domain S-box-containing protein
MIPINPPAVVEVNEQRQYVAVNDRACSLLGYSREELLKLRIDDLSFPSGAHVSPMFEWYQEEGVMRGLFALLSKEGEIIKIRFDAFEREGHLIAHWTEYEVAGKPDSAIL